MVTAIAMDRAVKSDKYTPVTATSSPEIFPLARQFDPRGKGRSVLSPYTSNIQSTSDYEADAKANLLSQERPARDEMLDLVSLPQNERPTQKSFKNGFALIAIFAECSLLPKLQIWPTNNCTIEFGKRINENTQFILETGNQGISGFIRIDGTRYTIRSGTSKEDLKNLLLKFADVQ
jgi:hypothetical protein